MEIIGIGNAGREICKLFDEKGYTTYSIDTHKDAFVKFPKVKTIEAAEKVQIDLSELKNNIKSNEIVCYGRFRRYNWGLPKNSRKF